MVTVIFMVSGNDSGTTNGYSNGNDDDDNANTKDNDSDSDNYEYNDTL